ncbi:MAG: hypothetical protein RL756_626 [Pseudomonadota bacterium]|jgi:electron transport complex protein RnfG
MSRSRLTGSVALIAIALACAVALAVTRELTAPRIAAERAAAANAALLDMTGRPALPPEAWSGNLWHLCDGTALMRGRADGYAGAIEWLLFIDVAPASRIRALRVIAHRETPGIADFLNEPQHPWMQAFVARGAGEPPPDTLTGATITTRALGQSLTTALATATPPGEGECP